MFEKGQPKPKNSGRRKGSRNKVPDRVKQTIVGILENTIDVQAEILQLEAKDKVRLWLELVEYVTPKMQRRDPELEERLVQLEEQLNRQNNGKEIY